MRARTNIRISKYGTITGGLCDQAHVARSKRAQGAFQAVQYSLDKECLVGKNGWWRMAKVPKYPSFPSKAYFDLFIDSDYEIGFLRFMGDVACKLVEEKRAFRWKWLMIWAESIAGFEFGVSGGEHPFDLKGMCSGYTKPWQDSIYQQKKKDGVLEKNPCQTPA